jgi:hypothetical protein
MKKLLSLAIFAVAFFMHSPLLFASNPAIQCISIDRNMSGGADIKNICNAPVEVFWCVENHDCKHGTWGMTNQTTLKAGGSYPAIGSIGKTVHAFACDERNASLIEQGPNQFGCR